MALKPIKGMTLREAVFYLEVTLKKLAYREILLDMWKCEDKKKNPAAKKKISCCKEDIKELDKRKEDIKEHIILLCGQKAKK
ncbi:TPA: hypothetical protein HA265_02135 [Candidatus Woesearchaeota archaeon]|nr:hypothetical protein [Candidatus Woesearchaeota archaeon]